MFSEVLKLNLQQVLENELKVYETPKDKQRKTKILDDG